MSLRTILGLVGALSVCGVGCGGGADPEPFVGSTVSFSWRIDGRDPRTVQTACADAGVQFIQLVLVSPGDLTDVRLRLQWDCSLGAYRSSVPELPAGSWAFYIEAVARDGRRLSVAPARRSSAGAIEPAPEALTVMANGHVDLDRSNTTDPSRAGFATNFATGTGPLEVALRWQTRDSAGDCVAAGVTRIRWQLVTPNGAVIDDHTTTADPCEEHPTLRWDRTLYDDYTVIVRGYGAAETPTHEGRCTSLFSGRDTTASTNYRCEVPFRIAGGP